MEYKHAKEFIEAVFPEVKVTEPIVIPEDIIPLYEVWCRENGKEE